MSAPHDEHRDRDRYPVPPGGGADSGPGGSGSGSGSELDGPDIEALGAVLRERMHQAVGGLEPQPGTLDHLRRAVPARRRRRQAAMATTAVTVLAVGAGVALAARGTLDSPQPTRTAGGADVGNLLSTATNGVPGGGSGHGPGPVGGMPMSSATTAEPTAASSATSLSQTSKAPPTTASVPSSASGAPVLPPCQDSAVKSVTGTQSTGDGGVLYETVVGTVKTACTLAGTPTLAVVDGHGGSGHVPQYKPDPLAAPLLAAVPAGQKLVLQPGDRFQFQFAWVPLTCPPSSPTSVPPTSGATTPPTSPTTGPTVSATATAPTSGPTTAPSTTAPTPTGTASSSAPSAVSYTVSFAVSGTRPEQFGNFAAACGASLYVTDYFPAEAHGALHVGPSLTASASATR